MSENLIEPQPHRASSVYYAIESAPESARLRLLALYALNRKWTDAAHSTDAQFAVSTLNWWHNELEACQKAATAIPALRALQAEIWRPECAQTIQLLLHGHMHWHHLNRVDTIEQLQPTIDAMGGQFAKIWMLMCGAQIPETLVLHAGRALWWIDHIRHIGHNLSNERQWIPMQWLKECDLPAHLLLQKPNTTQLEPAWNKLLQQLIAQAQSEMDQYTKHHDRLSPQMQKSIRSWHVLMNLRADLFELMQRDRVALFHGLVTLPPLKKWWRVVRS